MSQNKLKGAIEYMSKLDELPRQFNILTLRNQKTGVWIAQLLDYNVTTEADSFYELVFNVNDLIYTFFDVPENLQSKVTYLPTKEIYNKEISQSDTSIEEMVKFNILLAPQLAQYKHG